MVVFHSHRPASAGHGGSRLARETCRVESSSVSRILISGFRIQRVEGLGCSFHGLCEGSPSSINGLRTLHMPGRLGLMAYVPALPKTIGLLLRNLA